MANACVSRELSMKETQVCGMHDGVKLGQSAVGAFVKRYDKQVSTPFPMAKLVSSRPALIGDRVGLCEAPFGHGLLVPRRGGRRRWCKIRDITCFKKSEYHFQLFHIQTPFFIDTVPRRHFVLHIQRLVCVDGSTQIRYRCLYSL
jgi:hypothetical protein